MDFFQAQDSARQKTGRLVVMFVAAVIAIAVLTHLVISIGIVIGTGEGGALIGDWRVALAALGGTILIVGGGSLYKLAALRGGGSVIAESLGGRRLYGDSRDPVERKILNVVEEMSIASGVPCPPVYMMDGEDGINAFAAGFQPEDAVIGVTRGCAELLDRDELQGVMAHEFSHILNGDMRLNIRLMGVLHGILIIGIIGYFLLRTSFFAPRVSRRDNREGGSAALAMLAVGGGLALIGFMGTFFGNMIKAAVSRQREYLADASAVQFTRNPRGIADALKKIGGLSAGSTLRHPNAPVASHMYFGRGVSGLNGLFSTHPPLDDRIQRIDPAWDGNFVEPQASAPQSSAPQAQQRTAPAQRVPPAGMAGFAASAGTMADAVQRIGQPTEAHLEYAGALIQTVPQPLLQAARETYSARALVYALLMSSDADTRRKQLESISLRGERGMPEETQRLLKLTSTLDLRARLPLIDLAIAALRAMSPTQYQAFRWHLGELISADKSVDLFEWSLHRILQRHVDAQFIRLPAPRMHVRDLAQLSRQCGLLMSALAWSGQREPTDAQHAFEHGANALQIPGLTMHGPESCTPRALDQAVSRLAELVPEQKRRLLEGAIQCIAADGQIRVTEAELFRAVADSLGCPIPPLLPDTHDS